MRNYFRNKWRTGVHKSIPRSSIRKDIKRILRKP